MPTARMPRPTRLFLAGNTVSMVGIGLVIGFVLIYLHQVRGLALPVVGGLFAASAAAGLLVVPVLGILLDRLGARQVLTAIQLGQGTAMALLAWVHTVPAALPVMVLYGVTWAPMFPALQTMIAGLTPDPAAQQRAFAINFTLQNAAIGVGLAIGATIADVHRAGSFQVLFLADAASCVVFAAVLQFLPTLRRSRADDEPKAAYRDLLTHRGLRLVLVASLLLAFTSFPAFDSGLPAFATVEGHVSARVVALSMTANTAVIVAAQLTVLKVIRRVRRSYALVATGLIFGVSWAVFGLAGLPLTSAGRIACVVGFTALFGLGETVMSPTMGPLVNSLTDDRVRGRANALASASTSLALIVSPAIATGLIALHAAGVWIGLLCLCCLGTVAIGARLRHTLTAAQDHVSPTPAPLSEPARPAGLTLINKTSVPRIAWEAGDSWTLADQPRIHVMQERIVSGWAERRHLHAAVEQLYFILEGTATVRLDDREEILGPGDAMHVPAATPHQVRNDSQGALELLVISSAPPRQDRVDLDRP
jgi:mannose-6-phosphate isomerase-like protein (cupin superfamily)/predicted MFS family arabinose efflux permease